MLKRNTNMQHLADLWQQQEQQQEMEALQHQAHLAELQRQ
jgi:hypothetical protein